jgi:hypothetical protein
LTAGELTFEQFMHCVQLYDQGWTGEHGDDPHGDGGHGDGGHGDGGHGDGGHGAQSAPGNVASRHRHRPGPPSIYDHAEKLMKNVVDMQDIEERISDLKNTPEGEKILDSMYAINSPTDMFLYFISYTLGFKAPKRFQAACILSSSKNKHSICWKAGGQITVQDLQRSTLFEFFRAAYVMFDRVMLSHDNKCIPESLYSLVRNMFDEIPYGPGRAGTFTFYDLLLSRVRDKRLIDDLLLVEEYGVLRVHPLKYM